MTLGKAKQLLYNIIDEAKPRPETNEKVINFFNLGQSEIALYYPLHKTARFAAGEPRALPADFYKAVRCEDENKRCVNFFIDNNELICAEQNVWLIYEALLSEIPPNAPDSYELEIQSEAILALLYFAAAQLNNNEDSPSVFQSYFSQYQGKLQNLSSRPSQAPAAVTETGAENVYSL